MEIEQFEHVLEGKRDGFHISATNGQHSHRLCLVPSHMPEVARFIIVCLDAFESAEDVDGASKAAAKLAKVEALRDGWQAQLEDFNRQAEKFWKRGDKVSADEAERQAGHFQLRVDALTEILQGEPK